MLGAPSAAIQPEASVVMISYKHAAFIREAIEGVLMQECDFGVELIIADDASPDSTSEVVKELASHPNYDRVKYTKHATNKGMVDNFVWALNQAKGRYVALCEGDDYWTDPLKLQKQVDLMRRTKADCCVTFWRELANGSLTEWGSVPNSPGSDGTILMEKDAPFHYYHFSTRLIRRSVVDRLIQRFPAELVLDTPMLIILEELFQVVVLPEYTSTYRRSGAGIWTSQSSRAQHKTHYEMFKLLAEHLPEKRVSLLQQKWDAWSKWRGLDKIPLEREFRQLLVRLELMLRPKAGAR